MSEKEKLIQMIKEDENIIRYRKIENLINEHKVIKSKIQQLKAIQKQLVNAKEIGKTEAVQVFQQKFDALYQEIEDFPLMSEYLALQGDINDMLQTIQDIIQDGIESDFET